MKIEFVQKFYKDLDKIPSTTKIQVADLINNITTHENFNKIPQTKKLIGFKTAYRIRIGDYRIGVFYENDVIEFARILHRKEIYKFFP